MPAAEASERGAEKIFDSRDSRDSEVEPREVHTGGFSISTFPHLATPGYLELEFDNSAGAPPLRP